MPWGRGGVCGASHVFKASCAYDGGGGTAGPNVGTRALLIARDWGRTRPPLGIEGRALRVLWSGRPNSGNRAAPSGANGYGYFKPDIRGPFVSHGPTLRLISIGGAIIGATARTSSF